MDFGGSMATNSRFGFIESSEPRAPHRRRLRSVAGSRLFTIFMTPRDDIWKNRIGDNQRARRQRHHQRSLAARSSCQNFSAARSAEIEASGILVAPANDSNSAA